MLLYGEAVLTAACAEAGTSVRDSEPEEWLRCHPGGGCCDCREGQTGWAGHLAGVNQLCTLGRPQGCKWCPRGTGQEGLGEPQGWAELGHSSRSGSQDHPQHKQFLFCTLILPLNLKLCAGKVVVCYNLLLSSINYNLLLSSSCYLLLVSLDLLQFAFT